MRIYLESLEQRHMMAADFLSADFSNDHRVDARDVNLLVREIAQDDARAEYDLTRDGVVDGQDLSYLVEEIMQTRAGDVDLGGNVDFSDFLTLSQNFGKREAVWEDGDFDGTGGVDFADFLALSRNWGYVGTRQLYTHLSADGNRYLPGWANLEAVQPVDVQLPFVPEWTLASRIGDRDYWYAVSSTGEFATGFIGQDGVVGEYDSDHLITSAGQPPALNARLGQPQSGASQPAIELLELISPPASASPPESIGSHAVVSTVTNHLAYINENADLVVVDHSNVSQTIEINALPDSRILTDNAGRFLVLTRPSTEYPHGIFGDRIEPTGFAIVDANSSPPSVSETRVPEGRVIESLTPTWMDVDDDGQLEVIVTISDLSNGGQVTIYDENGEVEQQGPGIGRGFRWRHQLAVAPFGPAGEVEFVDVLTPHIGGVVEFRSLDATDLPIVGRLPGFTSHVNRTPNLDMAVASDFDSDGNIELLLPNQRRDTLAAITRSDAGAQVDWQLDLEGTLTTNIAVSRGIDGRVGVVVGLADGRLRIWRSVSE